MRSAFRSLRAFRGDLRGAAAVEFALLATVFLTLLFAILDTMLIFVAQLALDDAVADVARQVETGQTQKKSLAAADFRKLICAEASHILSCDKILFDLRSYDSFAAIPSRATMNGNEIDTTKLGYENVGPSAVGALRAYYKWPIELDLVARYLSSTGDNARILASTAVFKTEPF